MGWRFVKQPNGLLARFSDVVDDFTDINLSESDAIAMCTEGYGMASFQAKTKVLAGHEDWVWTPDKKGSGLCRWRDSLSLIEMVHGKEKACEAIRLAASG